MTTANKENTDIDLSKISLGALFGITSPKRDLKKIPANRFCNFGTCTELKPDPKFVFEYKSVKKALMNIKRMKPVYSWGPSGCGKTEFWRQIAARLRVPFFVISFGEESSYRELLGMHELDEKNGATVTHRSDGLLVKALKTPKAIIILDEIDTAPPGVSTMLNTVLDEPDKRELSIPETGEKIKIAEGVCFVATANTNGSFDVTGIYNGTQSMNAATLNRFAPLQMDYLTSQQEETVLLRYFPKINNIIQGLSPEKTFTQMAVDMAVQIRTLVSTGAVSHVFSIRSLLSFAESSMTLVNAMEGFEDAYYDFLSAEDAVKVNKVFHNVFGVELDTSR